MDKAQTTDLYYLMKASLSRNSYPGLPQHCSLWSSVVRKGRYLRFSICHFLSSFKEISVETCNTFNRVWKDELNSFGWKMVLVAQMKSLLNSWGKRSRTQLLLTDFSDSTTQKLMKYVTLCLHCPHLFLLATKSHWSFETGASLKSLTYASHIFSHQKGLGAPGPASKALLRSPGSQDQYLDAQVLDVALLALAHWTAWCVLLLLFSSSLPFLCERTKHHAPPKHHAGQSTCIHQRSSFLFSNHTASSGVFHLLPGTWAASRAQHSCGNWGDSWNALLALQQHWLGWKHDPEHGITHLRMLCNKTTRNLLSFMARKKLWLRKMHWLPIFCSWLLVSVSIYVILKAVNRLWTLRHSALRKCSTAEKNGELC